MSDRMQKITDESEVSTTELATVLGVSARRVQQMAPGGTMAVSCKRSARGASSLPIPSSGMLSSCPTVRWTKRIRSWRRPAAWRRRR